MEKQIDTEHKILSNITQQVRAPSRWSPPLSRDQHLKRLPLAVVAYFFLHMTHFLWLFLVYLLPICNSESERLDEITGRSRVQTGNVYLFLSTAQPEQLSLNLGFWSRACLPYDTTRTDGAQITITELISLEYNKKMISLEYNMKMISLEYKKKMIGLDVLKMSFTSKIPQLIEQE